MAKEKKSKSKKKKVKATLTRERVLTEISDGAKEFYNQSRFGNILGDGNEFRIYLCN